jgi:HK97 family phage portal protein
MNIRNLFKKKPNIEERDLAFSESLLYGSTSYSQNKAMNLSTVYRCVEVISDSIAQLPISVLDVRDNHKHPFIKHPAYDLLRSNPNQNISRYTFMKLMVTSMLLKGNAYAYIVRDEKYNAKEIHFIPSEYVTIVKPKFINEKLRYKVTGFKSDIEAENMIHILNYTNDGFEGISTLSAARQTLALSYASESHAANFFSAGAGVGGILKVNTPLNQKQKEQLKSSWVQAFNPSTGSNGVAVLEGNMDFQSITVNPVDAQLLESRQFQTVEICRYFNCNPCMVFDYSNSNYSTVEASNLSFMTNTLSPIIEKFKLEFVRKIFKPSERKYVDIEFDITKFLALNKQAEGEYYTKLLTNGILNINEIRSILGYCPVEGGDTYLVPCNLANLKFTVNQTNDQLVDNKIEDVASEDDVEQQDLVDNKNVKQ